MSSIRNNGVDFGKKLFPKYFLFYSLMPERKYFRITFLCQFQKFLLAIKKEKIVINLSTKFRTSQYTPHQLIFNTLFIASN